MDQKLGVIGAFVCEEKELYEALDGGKLYGYLIMENYL